MNAYTPNFDLEDYELRAENIVVVPGTEQIPVGIALTLKDFTAAGASSFQTVAFEDPNLPQLQEDFLNAMEQLRETHYSFGQFVGRSVHLRFDTNFAAQQPILSSDYQQDYERLPEFFQKQLSMLSLQFANMTGIRGVSVFLRPDTAFGRDHAPHPFAVLNRVFGAAGTVTGSPKYPGLYTAPEAAWNYMKAYTPHYSAKVSPEILKQRILLYAHTSTWMIKPPAEYCHLSGLNA